MKISSKDFSYNVDDSKNLKKFLKIFVSLTNIIFMYKHIHHQNAVYVFSEEVHKTLFIVLFSQCFLHKSFRLFHFIIVIFFGGKIESHFFIFLQTNLIFVESSFHLHSLAIVNFFCHKSHKRIYIKTCNREQTR